MVTKISLGAGRRKPEATLGAGESLQLGTLKQFQRAVPDIDPSLKVIDKGNQTIIKVRPPFRTSGIVNQGGVILEDGQRIVILDPESGYAQLTIRRVR